MTGFGTNRRETTKMKDTKHPEYDHEKPDQSEIPLQAGKYLLVYFFYREWI